MYSLYKYSNMVGDKVRMQAHVKALEKLITKDSVLIDLGAGWGIFSLIACQLGARKIYAIESSSSIGIGKELARLNGFHDRIEWIREDSRKVTLKEKADILVADLRGMLPLCGENISAISDASNRFLKKGGHLIPLKDTLNVALVENEKAYNKYVQPWAVNNFGLDLNPLIKCHANQLIGFTVPKEKHLISTSEQWVIIDYQNLSEPKFENTVNLVCNRDAKAHGFYLWFDAELIPGLGFSGGPGKEASAVYGNAFFPWTEPVDLKAGDTAVIHIAASLVKGEYLWRWNTEIIKKNEKNKSASFNQSTFYSEIPDLHHLHKRSQSYSPELNEDGEFEKAVLQLMDGKNNLEAIARDLMIKYPDRLSNYDESVSIICDLAEKFSL